jgi:hypothetical protein
LSIRERLSAIGVCACVLACGSRGAPANAALPAHVGAATSDGWASLSWEDRHDQMTFLVLPNMARLFQEFQHAPDPNLTCRSCHGADAERVAYRMPNGLHPLDPAHMPDPASGVAKFMTEQVTPKMIDFLGVEPFDAQSGRGFGCFNCHASSGR